MKYYLKSFHFDGMDIITANREELIFDNGWWYTQEQILAFPDPPEGIWEFDLNSAKLTDFDPREGIRFENPIYIVGRAKQITYLELGFQLGLEYARYQSKELCLLN